MSQTKIEWKDKIIEILIGEPDDKPEKVEIEAVVWKKFAIHEGWATADWTLTYMPAGKTLCGHIPSIAQAKELAEKLWTLDWSKVKDKGPIGSRNIILDFCKKLGIKGRSAHTHEVV